MGVPHSLHGTRHTYGDPETECARNGRTKTKTGWKLRVVSVPTHLSSRRVGPIRKTFDTAP